MVTTNPQREAATQRGETNYPEPVMSRAAVSVDSDRLQTVRRATEIWTSQLVDLSGRNNLLYFKDLRVGTLSLDSAPRELIIRVLSGQSILLSRFFRSDEARANAAKRARAIHNKARARFEEQGIETLYLACGMATWSGERSSVTPCAPVLLVPVQLSPRGGSQEVFELAVTGELEVNPTLLQMLSTEFQVECDPIKLFDSAKIDGIIDTQEELDAAYSWLRRACEDVPSFDIAERFVIGSFSYAKLPMVRDLENSLEALAANDITAALAGDAGAQQSLRNAGSESEVVSPDHTPPSDEFLVLDADSSQNYAINAVLSGRNLIIKGPPGTGKSQTITNLVSALIARGKRVLFVAEKRAAIDAVLRRLEEVSLGDLVLDLHGGVSSRRETAEALARALDTNSTLAKPNLGDVHNRLQQTRAKLNDRVDALHVGREPWGLSFFEIDCELLGLPTTASNELRFHGRELEKFDPETAKHADDELRQFAGLGGFRLGESESLWSRATVMSAEDAQALMRRVEAVRRHLRAHFDRLTAAAHETGLTTASSITGWNERLVLWQRISGVLEKWQPIVFDLPMDQILADCEALERSIASRASAAVTSSDYRTSRRALRQALGDGQKISGRALHAACTEISDVETQWQQLRAVEGNPAFPPILNELLESHSWFTVEIQALSERLNRTLSDRTDLLDDELGNLLADSATLSKLPELHRLRSSLEGLGLADLLQVLAARSPDRNAVSQTFRFSLLHSLREHLQLNDPQIGAFDGDSHRETVDDFTKVDHEHIQTTAQRVRRICAEQAVGSQDDHPDLAKLVQAEAAKKRRHLSIRQLFSAAPDVLTSLKPCWAMSPLVVSQVLPSDKQYFDVVIFDEASQVRPADAIPAILRGKQIVVAGDERQLPPTDFFASFGDPYEEEPESQIERPALAVDASYESILEGLAGFIDSRMLLWHYRSRDERLIAFSNVYLYDRALTTFPGVAGPDCIRHELVPFELGQVGSDTSASTEVERVVQLVIDHAEHHPAQSLGVIAMGIKHANRIEETLRATLRDRADLDEFFDESVPEPFFVKNLERVQGDERDAIILSVGYGKNEEGRLLYRFGPLNQEGGERRLNVAVTRAKRQMTLVSSFSYLDMDPDRSSAKGVQLLRAYLEYCASNGANLGEAAREIPELNPFEIDVRDTLTRAGIPLAAQFGCSGYRIDFAAKHPQEPGRMVLAIECDGASYHSSATARDRDRLRQEQLERLGWTFHRIWSQTWFNDREGEVARAKSAYEAAVQAADNPDVRATTNQRASASGNRRTPISTNATTSQAGALPAARRDAKCPVATGRRQIDDYTDSELVELVRWIKSDTLLRTEDQLLSEVVKTLGYRRRGSKIVRRVKAAIAEAK